MSTLLPIYMYHHIVPEDELPQDRHLYVSPQILAQQIIYLKHWGYELITLAEAWKRIFSGENSGKAVVLTFDDLYFDFYKHAWPVLQDLGVRGTAFAIADNVCAGETPKMVAPGIFGITEGQLGEMVKAGLEIGSHTLTHRELTTLSDSEVEREVVGSKRVLEEIISAPITSFCYPRGHFSLRIEDAVTEAGYVCACTTLRGTMQEKKTPFRLKRVRASQERLGFKLWYTTTGFYNMLNVGRCKRDLRRLAEADKILQSIT